MPSDYSRTDRIGEQIKRELAMLIRNEIKDPRVGMVSVVDVQVSSDLKIAKVYFDILPMDAASEIREFLFSFAVLILSIQAAFYPRKAYILKAP